MLDYAYAHVLAILLYTRVCAERGWATVRSMMSTTASPADEM